MGLPLGCVRTGPLQSPDCLPEESWVRVRVSDGVVLYAVLKFSSVALISGCDFISFGILLGFIQGRCVSGSGVNACSIWIQSLLWLCTYQSTILVRWQAQWYFWMSGRFRPPCNLGIVNLVQLSLGILEVHMNVLHIFLYVEKKDSGSCMGMA